MGATHIQARIENYDFTSKLKMSLMIMMAIGAISMTWTWFVDDESHTRFWTNLLHNATFVTGIAFTSLFFLCVCITAWAGWVSLFKRLWEAMSMFLLPALIIMTGFALCIYFNVGHNHLYHWADHHSVETDTILSGKASFLNKNWYLFGTLIIVGAWYLFAKKIRSISVDEDTNGTLEFKHHHSLRIWAPAFLPVAGFTSAAIIWQWIMSLDAHWYSTMFAWYSGASWFVSMISTTILILLYLKSKGYYQQVSSEHIHDLGKFMFAFSIFWTYLWFSQFMLIWYANVGEETGYFKLRMEEFPILFWGNLLINFILPFFILMRNDTKRKAGSLIFVAIMVIFGHWLDFFLMIKPGAMHTAHELASHGAEHGHDVAHATGMLVGFHIPGFLEIGTFIGFIGLFLFVFFSALARVPMTPKNDPYLQESLHHHV